MEGCISLRSRLPGRERWHVPIVLNNIHVARSLELTLAAKPGIRSVAANALSGRVLVQFEPSALQAPLKELLYAALKEQPVNAFQMSESASSNASLLHGLVLSEIGCLALKGIFLSSGCVSGAAVAATAMFFLLPRHAARWRRHRATAGRVVDQSVRVKHHEHSAQIVQDGCEDGI